MIKRLALCADSVTLGAPELVGLDGESLEAQPWLRVFANGADARVKIRDEQDIREAWVVSADDVDGINLAAALKADRPDLTVRMVRFDADGSFSSRAHTAAIDEVMGRSAFVKSYFDSKRQFAGHNAGLLADLPDPGRQNAHTAGQIGRFEGSGVHPSGHAFLLPVVSGSGGAGKSAVAVLGALASARLGYRTLLLDCDFQFGDIAAMLGAKNALTVDEVVANNAKADALGAGGGMPAVVAAPKRLEDGESAARALPGLLESFAPRFDVIVANTGASWQDVHALLLERSSAALFLVDQRASSLAACKHAVELCSRCGIATSQFKYAVNRCSKAAPYTSLDVSCALRGSTVFELRDGGRDVEDYLAAGCASDLAESGNPLYGSVVELLAKVLPEGEAAFGKLEEERQSAQVKRRSFRSKQRKRGRR